MLDILAFGAHPDDVEIGIGGTLALHVERGYRCGIIDLTRGEMASTGTVEIRARESLAGAHVLGVEIRENTALPDAYLRPDQEAINKVVRVIRKYKPKIVLAPFYRDYHPDHKYASLLVQEASYLAGLKKFPVNGKPHRPQQIFYYFLGQTKEPLLVVDISSSAKKKWQAIACHKSQFSFSKDKRAKTAMTLQRLVGYVRGRDQFFGALIGAKYGEGLVSESKIAVRDLLTLGSK